MAKSLEAARDVAASLRARNPIIWINTKEERRVEQWVFKAAENAALIPRTWDIAQGVASLSGDILEEFQGSAGDVNNTLGYVATAAKTGKWDRGAWIMRDLHVWLRDAMGYIPCRMLRNLAYTLSGARPDRAQSLVIIAPSSQIPEELTNQTTLINWPLPDREEIGEIVDLTIENIGKDDLRASALEHIRTNGNREAAIDACVGLSGEEAESCFARSLVLHKRIDPATVAREKKRIIERTSGLTWIDPLPGGLAAVGGLDLLKSWLIERKAAYGPKARAYGLPMPHGACVVGVAGCGKSLTAKAVATAWGVPCLRLDMGALKSKYVGDSEQKIRESLAVIDAIGPCVVWLDEIEKAMQGGTSDGAADGGVSSDALGVMLTWLQDKQGGAFVFATCNDASKLPPELLRKGRFDDIWFVDLPNSTEREQIILTAMKSHGRTETIDAAKVVAATENFSGVEVATLVESALFAGFADGERPITTEDLVAATKRVVTLYKTKTEEIDKLRLWAKNAARPSSTPDVSPTSSDRPSGRRLDL